MSDVASFCVGGFQNIKGKKGTEEEEDISKLYSQDRKGEGLPFCGHWQWLVFVLITLTGCLIRAAGALVLGKGKSWGRPGEAEECPLLQPTHSQPEGSLEKKSCNPTSVPVCLGKKHTEHAVSSLLS